MNFQYFLLLCVFFVNKNQICSANLIRSETAEIPELSSDTEEAEKICQECPSSDGYFQSPSDCGSGKFFYCSQGKIVHNFECAGSFNTTVFDPESTICDRPENVKCDTKNRTLTIENESSSCLNHSESSVLKLSIPSNKIDLDTDPMDDTNNDDYKIVCYLASWAFHRTGIAKYIPENTNVKYCTHINYAFAALDNSSLTIKIRNSTNDVANGFLKRVIGLKRYKQNLKILLSLGGWNDSAGDKYSRLVNNPEARKFFINNVIEFLPEYGFDGLDLDWEYPKCWQAACQDGPESDKSNFALLVSELRQAFDSKGYLLTAAVSSKKSTIEASYDVPSLANDLDFINVMAYNMHGSWKKFAAHHAPLDSWVAPKLSDSNEIYLNVNYSINYWISKGMPKKKVILGIPFYGRSFTLAGQASSFELKGYRAKSIKTGEPGRWTKQAGILSFFEICDNLKNEGWNKSRDPITGSPFAYKGNQWVGYDDPEQVRKKTEFIKSVGIGGAMVWSLDKDDFNGHFCSTKWALLKTLNSGLRGLKSYVYDELSTDRI